MLQSVGRAVCIAFLAVTFQTLLLTTDAAAEPREDVEALYQALDLGGIVRVMRTEGRTYGDDLEEQMFAGRGGAAWQAVVDDIYDAAAMEAVVIDALARELADADTTPMLEFFTSDRGQRIVGLELSAREALLDKEVEAVSEQRLQELRDRDDPRLAILTEFIQANDLIESNVVGGLNSSYAFYQGLSDGGALGDALNEDQILADVWGQEDSIRDDTTSWLFSYLVLAYQPLDDADIEAYIAFSKTSEGQVLNRALFDAFDEMYTGISRALGRTAAQYLTGEDI